jgi:glutamate-1-semialdehyde 2,1-aminomutase
MSVFFTDRQVTDYRQAVSSDTNRYARYFHYMLEHGIYLAPAQFEAMFISAAHTDEDIEYTCTVFEDYMKNEYR